MQMSDMSTVYLQWSLWLLLIWTHRENLARLAQGTENRFDKVMLLKPRR